MRSPVVSGNQANNNNQPRNNNNNRGRNNNRRYRGNRNRRPSNRVLNSNQVVQKYENLLDQHLINRRKYFEYYDRVDYNQLRKLEDNFYNSIEHLRRFESNLEDWQKDYLKKKTDRYVPDRTYSLNHELDPAAYPVEISDEQIEDPHFTDAQKEAFELYKEDTEESVGTYEDYLKLKGLN
jgi:hypothetical protein